MPADSTQKEMKYPYFTGVGHPELFTTIPPQPAVKKPGQLTEAQVKQYYEEGFLVVKDFFTMEEISPVIESFKKLVDRIAQRLFETGRIKDTHSDKGFDKRLLALEKDWPGASMLLIKLGKLTPEFRALYQNEKLLNVMEQFLGPEIGANPIWNTRPKLPQHELSDVPWHQDSAFLDTDSYETFIGSVWTAFNNITTENGCLEFCKGGHKKGLIARHECCNNLYLMLQEQEMIDTLGANPETDFVKCPMTPGSVVFFNNMVPHRGTPNVSDHIRWGMDFRYQSPKRPWGFFGLKDGILLRSPDNPDLVPDWDFYDGQDRYVNQKEYEIEKTGQGKVDEFDTYITGPWMEKWELVQHNPHVDQYLAERAREK